MITVSGRKYTSVAIWLADCRSLVGAPRDAPRALPPLHYTSAFELSTVQGGEVECIALTKLLNVLTAGHVLPCFGLA
jgi:hypothetical protein